MRMTPWFRRNLVARESAAWSASPTGTYHQFAADGTPLKVLPGATGSNPHDRDDHSEVGRTAYDEFLTTGPTQ
ncbi:MAG TPA: hypothetical protein VJQ82_02695 [Terriglobales bacterium]|nr:hypothetical protein [Terriglobales bacterium]